MSVKGSKPVLGANCNETKVLVSGAGVPENSTTRVVLAPCTTDLGGFRNLAKVFCSLARTVVLWVPESWLWVYSAVPSTPPSRSV